MASPPLASLPRLVRGLKTSCLVVLGRMIGDQDLLSSYLDIVFEHKVFVCLPEQVIHRCRRLLCKRLKKGYAQVDISLEDLQDDIHIIIVGFHMELAGTASLSL